MCIYLFSQTVQLQKCIHQVSLFDIDANKIHIHPLYGRPLAQQNTELNGCVA